MTLKQTANYKAANQRRKYRLIEIAKSGNKQIASYYANMGHIQDGKHTKRALSFLKRVKNLLAPSGGVQ